MNYRDCLSYLARIQSLGIKFGLDNVRAVMSELGDPQKDFKTIQVAGSNGKGSVCAMVTRILTSHGIKCGLFTSPHLVDIEERIRIGDDLIHRTEFCRLLEFLKQKIQNLIDRGVLKTPPTYFELMTLLAVLYFKESCVDMAVLEVGMGGRFDATTAVDPVVTAITTISGEHQEYLGESLSQIAFEKAGIILQNADNVVIENNIITDNGDQGIRIFSSNHNIIRNNIISNNVYYGIWLYNSRENLIIDNSFINDGLVMREGSYSSFIQTITNNTVNGKPLYYYLNKKGVSIPEDAGQIILVNCSHITVKNFSISNASIGLEIAYSSFIKILNNNFSNNNLNGIRLYYSENNEISYNILYKNGWGGLSLWYSSNNSISHNDIGRNAYDDIEILFSSNGNKIFSNVVRDTPYGIGIRQSDGNIIHWNNIYNHEKYGMIAQDAKVNARWNWWGSFTGIIFGDKIATNNGRIYFFPWLPFPVPVAV